MCVSEQERIQHTVRSQEIRRTNLIAIADIQAGSIPPTTWEDFVPIILRSLDTFTVKVSLSFIGRMKERSNVLQMFV
jgi:hypothetical protein